MRAMVMGVTSCPEVIACLCTSCCSRLLIKVLARVTISQFITHIVLYYTIIPDHMATPSF